MKTQGVLFATSLICLTSTFAQPTSTEYAVERIVQPSQFYGVHGLAFDAQDRLYAGSVVGRSVYAVDRNTGKVEVVVPAPEGMADDLVFLGDGTMVWTSISDGLVRARKGNEPVRTIAKLASINSINVRKRDGRLFAGQVFGGDGIWELDPTGEKAPRLIVDKPGGFNGFDIGPDGMLYGPLWFKRQVVRVHPDTGELTVIASDFVTPAAANFDSKGRLYVLDTAQGEVIRVDVGSGAKQVVAKLKPSLDNLAIDSRDRMFVSNMADNTIQEVNLETGEIREVVHGGLSAPRSLTNVPGRDELYVADVFAFRRVDGRSGVVNDVARSHAANTPIRYPISVTANEKHILLTDSSGHVQRYDRRTQTKLLEWERLRGAQTALELHDGDVLVAGIGGGTITRFSGTNGTQQKVIVKDLLGPIALGLSPNGSVYVSEGEAGQVSQLDLSHGTKHVIARGLKTPQGLAIGADGTLFVVERDRRQLTRIDARTGAVRAIATNLPVGRAGVGDATAGVATGTRGVLYVLSDLENSIYRLTPRRP